MVSDFLTAHSFCLYNLANLVPTRQILYNLFLSFRNTGFLYGDIQSRNIGINLWQSFGFVDCKNNSSPQKCQQPPGIEPGHHRYRNSCYLHPTTFPCSSCSKMGLARIHVQSPPLCAKYVCQCANSESRLDCKRQVCTIQDFF